MKTQRFALRQGRGYVKSQLGNPIMFATKTQALEWSRFTKVNLNKVEVIKVTVTIEPTKGLEK